MPTDKPSALKLAFTAVYILCFPALLFALAGDWRWRQGWIFSAWFLALSFGTIAYLYLYNPSLLAERYKLPGTSNQQGWDVAIYCLIALGFLAWLAIIPLDARRHHWSPPAPRWLEITGAALLLGSMFLFLRSFADNPFLSPLVRLQRDRKQEVVSTGVYSFVRHPMYLGAALMFFGAPLLMGSRLGSCLGGAMTLLLAGRIVGEERMLSAGLPGYEAYKTKVKARLIPFVW